MATATLGGLIAAARQLIPPDPDADLLRRFAATRDDGAFAALVARYGRLVLSACRRIVPDTHLADDAFQATFVVLATKAASLDGTRPLGSWLYGVACHVSTRARAMIGRRRKRETLTGTVPDVPDQSRGGTGFQAGDATGILDEEIGKLSAACRDAVVLCELQGLTRKQAAAKLGIAEGTLSSRLAAARKTLAARLKARGVAPISGIISAIFVPTDLAAAAVAVSTGTVDLSPQLTTLVQKGLAMTLLAKLKLVPAVVALGLLLLGAAGWGGSSNDTAVAAPVPKAEKDDGLLWMLNGKTGTLTAFAPDGTKKQDVVLKSLRNFKGFTHDGESLLFLAKNGELSDAEDGLTLHIGWPGNLTKATDTGIACNANDPYSYMLTRDKKRVVRLQDTRNGPNPPVNRFRPSFNHTLIDLGTKRETPIDVPDHTQIIDESLDGKEWVGMQYNSGDDPKLPGNRYLRLPAKGGKPVPICDTHQFPFFVPAPDRGSYLGIGVSLPPKAETTGFSLYHFNPATGKATELEQFADTEQRNLRWSPDGKRYAVKKHGDADVYVADIDGKNRRKLFAVPDAGPETYFIGWFPTKVNAPDSRKRNAPVPKEKPPEGVILVSKLCTDPPNEILEVLDTSGKSLGHLSVGNLDNVRAARVSPDGKRLAFSLLNEKGKRHQFYSTEDLFVVDLPLTEPPKEPAFGDLLDPSFAWAPDGKTLVVSSIPGDTDVSLRAVTGTVMRRKTVRYDAAMKDEKAIELPKGHAVQDMTPDGKTLLTQVKVWNKGGFGYSSFLVPLDTLEAKRLGDEDDGFAVARFSPVGNRIVGTRVERTKSKETGLFLADATTGKVDDHPLSEELTTGLLDAAVSWAPDGRRLAVLWSVPAPGAPGLPGGAGGPLDAASRRRITVLDSDGKNAKTIREFAPTESPRHIEWADPKLIEKGKPPAAPQPKKNAPVPKADPDPGLIWTHHTKTNALIAYTPDGKKAKELTLPDGKHFLGFTADGTSILFAGRKGKADAEGGDDGLTLHMRGITDKPGGTDTGLGYKPNDGFILSPDGKRVVRSRLDKIGGVDAKNHEHAHVLFDLGTKKETKLDLPANYQVAPWAADGATWRVLQHNGDADPKLPAYRWLSVPVGGGKATPICDTHSLHWLDPSPDGKTYLAAGHRHPFAGTLAYAGFAVDAATGKATELVPLPKLAFAVARWSPDGKRIAAVRYGWEEGATSAGDTRLVLYDASGKGEKEILHFPDDGQRTHFLGWFPTKPKVPVPK